MRLALVLIIIIICHWVNMASLNLTNVPTLPPAASPFSLSPLHNAILNPFNLPTTPIIYVTAEQHCLNILEISLSQFCSLTSAQKYAYEFRYISQLNANNNRTSIVEPVLLFLLGWLTITTLIHFLISVWWTVN